MSDRKSVGGMRGVNGAKSVPKISNKVGALTIQEFADTVLSDGYSRGRELKIGNLNEVACRELQNMRISLHSSDVVLTDDVVMKYVSHPKQAKNAVLLRNRYAMIKNIVNNPKNIYIDKNQRNLVFVFTGKYTGDKVIKAIIQPNFKKGKKTYNKLKSIGIVESHHMKQPQFKKIK